MRLFVAVSIPAREQKRLFKAAKPLREPGFPVRWVEVGSMHLTLKFLGEVSPDRVERIEDVLGRVAGKSDTFDVALGGFGAFPSLRKPRVIWAGAYASPELRCLKHDLEWELASLGYEREARAFHPHVTLGRALPEARAGDFRDLEDAVAPLEFEGKVHAKSLELVRSTTGRDGARYENLASVGLGKLKERKGAAARAR